MKALNKNLCLVSILLSVCIVSSFFNNKENFAVSESEAFKMNCPNTSDFNLARKDTSEKLLDQKCTTLDTLTELNIKKFNFIKELFE